MENVSTLFVGSGEERSSGFFAACAFARPRRGFRAKQERKDFTRGPRAVSVWGRIVSGKGCCDLLAGAWEY